MNNDRIIRRLMAKHDRPFYLYDQKVMNRQADILQSSFQGFDFLYSLKTNPFPPVIRSAAAKGMGADAASAAEVDLALAAGIEAKNIFYSTPGKTRADLENSLGKCRIIADSLHELDLLNQLAEGWPETLPVGLRVNPDFSLGGGPGKSNKFGVDAEQLYQKKDWLQSLSNLKIEGLHVHLRSQVLDGPALAGYYAGVFEMAVALKRDLGWPVTYVNFGGGLGIAYSKTHDQPLDIPALSGECRRLWARYKDELGARLMIETGRFLIGEAGTYYTPVVDIKTSRGKKYVVVRNGLNGFLRPSIAGLMNACGLNPAASYSAEPLFTGPDAFEVSLLGKEGGPGEVVDVVGNLCTATDVLAVGLNLPQADIGDIVKVTMAGSYAYSLSSLLFASHPWPLQFFLDTRGNIITM